MSRKDSIFLTGGSGLLAVNWFYTKKEHYSFFLSLNKREIYPLGANIIFSNLSSEAELTEHLDKIRPAFVVHTAGVTDVEKCQSNPELAFKVNVEISSLVAKVTKNLGIKMVHISTDHLYDGRSCFYNEDSRVNPINVYGVTKAQAESAVLSINEEALVVRTNFYAWGTSYRRSFSDFIIDSLRSNVSICLFDDVNYTPIIVEKLVETVHNLVDRNAKGIYNVVSDNAITKYKFGILIAEEFGLNEALIEKCYLSENTVLVDRPFNMSLSNNKVKEFLGGGLGTVKQHIFRLRQQELEVNTKKLKLL